MSNKHHDLLGVPKHANQHRLSRLTMEVHTDELRIMASAVESHTDELIAALEAAEKRIAELSALASLEAEAVAWKISSAQGTFIGISSEPLDYDAVKYYEQKVEPLYTAPPAPVSVPDGVLKSLLPDAEKSEFWFEHDGKILFEGVKFNNAVFDACRAAMLQGAEPVTTAYKLRDAVEAIRNSGIAIDGEKIMAERDALNSPVIPDGWVMVPVELTPNMREAYHQAQAEYEDTDGLWCPDHQWQAMLAAAPQQEVK
ncbi:hypothetical protein ACYTK3_000249 [Enterobacter kobei]